MTNNALANIGQTMVRFGRRTGLRLQKHSPTILTVVGIGSLVTAGVLACRATLKAESVLDEHQEKVDKIDEALSSCDESEYSEDDAKKDKAMAFGQMIGGFVKIYWPSVTLAVGGTICILVGHGIMHKRNVALVAAYKAVEESFNNYRKRVVEEYGEEVDRDFKYGIRRETQTVETIDENGKKKKEKVTVEKKDPNGLSVYARFFDEGSVEWSKNPERNLMFLRCQQNYANELLKAQGHLFLNEVYDMLGIPRSQAGAVVGWILSKDSDNYVDFNIYRLNDTASSAFVNGLERSILLDFNVDGVIFDLI